MDLPFLPDWPLQANALMLFGGILLAGLVGGRLAQRTGFLPRITGFILIGFLLGPSALGLLDDTMLSQARVFVDVALAVILFQLGVRMECGCWPATGCCS